MSPKWIQWLKDNAPTYQNHVSGAFVKIYIDKLLSLGTDFIDYGFGSGYLSIALANKGAKVQALDLEPELLEWAETTAKQYRLPDVGELNFTLNESELKPADIVFSDGLFEHFDDQTIASLLEKQIALAKKCVVFNVPTADYPWPTFGDSLPDGEKELAERMMRINEWEKILSPFKDDLIELYTYGKIDKNKEGIFLIGVIRCPKVRNKKTKSEQ